MPSKIEWTDETLNPVVGCTKCSQGCKNCYAERMARRLQAMGLEQYQDVVDPDGYWTGEIGLNLAVLDKLKHWKKPRRVFMVSMGDLFHENVPTSAIAKVFTAMRDAPQHIYQLLTKRPQRMEDLWPSVLYRIKGEWPKNIWLGVTVENQEQADKRIPILLQIPAAVRFVSIEPMLTSVDLLSAGGFWQSRRTGGVANTTQSWQLLNWVICGGETGPGARPMDLQWARDIRDQCNAAHVPFFYKGAGTANHSKSKWGYRLLDDREWNEQPK